MHMKSVRDIYIDELLRLKTSAETTDNDWDEIVSFFIEHYSLEHTDENAFQHK